MGRYVQYGDKIVPAFMLEPTLNQKADCNLCGDSGYLIETIDEERFDVRVSCWKCRVYCKACRKDVKKSGHQCVGEPKEL
jgi:hypothetical protein